MLDLKNKHAIVTGGGTGIGRSIALHLAKEGCNLILTGLGINDLEKVKEECERLGVKAWAKETQLDDFQDFLIHAECGFQGLLALRDARVQHK